MAIGLLAVFRIVLVSFAWLILAPLLVSAIEVPPKPLDIPVVDQTNTLTADQKTQIASLIATERTQSGNQIAVLIVSSLEGEPIENYSLEVARKWGVGTKERNSGVLLIVAKDDRRLRIEVGYGLEGALTDIRSGQIIRDRITPEFKQGKYYEGIRSGVEGIISAIHGEVDPNLSTKPTSEKGFSVPWEAIAAALFFIPQWLGSILARTKSWWAGGIIGIILGVIVGVIFGFMLIGVLSIIALTVVGLLFDRAVSRNYQKHFREGGAPSWWAGGTSLGGGGGSDGFGGFGGGGFGGGGASGDW